ncbi:MAG: phosphatase PAP2 family protein [Clostridia bacterium]|nr:phosphatase PAP2 family protein [Clostridia bacterium]
MKIYEKQAKFYRAHPIAKKILLSVNILSTVGVFCSYIAYCVYALFVKDPKTADYLRLLGVPALGFLLASLLRIFINRPRPYERDVEPLVKKQRIGRSFPSRHGASAFVIGTTLCSYLLPLGIAVLILGLGFCYVRFATGFHYPSDLYAGAIIGVFVGLLAFL